MKYLFIILLFLSCFGCSKDDHTEEAVPRGGTTQNTYPWLKIENGHLGTVNVSSPSTTQEKKDVTFSITGKNSNTNWLVVFNNEEQNYNFTGRLNIETNRDKVKVIFVEGPIDIKIPNTNIYYRYNFEWNSNALTKAQVVNSCRLAKELMKNSKAEELVSIFESSQIHCFADSNSNIGGLAISKNKIKINVSTNIVAGGLLASTVIHEFGHLYDFRNSGIQTKKNQLYSKAFWQTPHGYYNTNSSEMFACSIAAYVIPNKNDNLGSFGIYDEAYYKNTIKPWLDTLFQ